MERALSLSRERKGEKEGEREKGNGRERGTVTFIRLVRVSRREKNKLRTCRVPMVRQKCRCMKPKFLTTRYPPETFGGDI